MNRELKKQVHPGFAAVMIIGVLICVLAAWYRGLIYQPPPARSAPGGPSGGGSAPNITVSGRTDVLVETLAGDLEPGHVDGSGHASRFDRPTGLAMDAQGNIYVADTGNHLIRKIAPDGETTTVAGSQPGFSDGATSAARFNSPCGVSVSPDGAIFVADTGNDRIRRISNGQVETVLGGDASNMNGRKLSLKLPSAVAYVGGVKPTLLIADTGNRRMVSCFVDGTGVQIKPGAATAVVGGKVSGSAFPGSAALIDGGRQLTRVVIDGPQNEALKLHRPIGLCPAPEGWYVTDAKHPAVFNVVQGTAYVVAGTCAAGTQMLGSRDGDGSKAKFSNLTGIISDGKDLIVVADTGNNMIRRIRIVGTSLPRTFFPE